MFPPLCFYTPNVIICLRNYSTSENVKERRRNVSNAKKVIYWSIYILLLFSGIALKMMNLLPIKATVIFLFGLMWIWTGVSLACRLNPYYAQNCARNSQLVFAVTSIGLGMAWLIISLTDLSSQAIPMILISTPFLVPDLIMFLRNKRK